MNDTSTKAPDETLREALAELDAANERLADGMQGAGALIYRAMGRVVEAARALATPTKPGFFGSIPAEESDEEFARQIASMDTPTKPEMQPEGLVSSCQALSETAGESAKKSEVAK